MDETSTDRRAFVEAILNRLRRSYVEQLPLPAPLDAPLTFEQLRRLCAHVISEGYGEDAAL